MTAYTIVMTIGSIALVGFCIIGLVLAVVQALMEREE